jgi:hypothetical protein
MSVTVAILVALMTVAGEGAPPTKLNFSKGFSDICPYNYPPEFRRATSVNTADPSIGSA